MALLAHGHKQEFNPVGYSQFVKNSKQTVLDGMGAQTQSLGNLTIGESLGHAMNDLHLPLGKQIQAPRIDGGNGMGRSKSVRQQAHLLAVGPDLPLMHSPQALAEYLHGFVSA